MRLSGCIHYGIIEYINRDKNNNKKSRIFQEQTEDIFYQKINYYFFIL